VQQLSAIPSVDLGDTATAITCGASFTCALLTSNRVRCWGLASGNQAGIGLAPNGIGDDETPTTYPPVVMPVNITVRAIAAGFAHVCVLTNDSWSGDDFVYCWGSSRGMMGATDTEGSQRYPTLQPLPAGATRAIASIAAGYDYTCIVLTSGNYTCWGQGNGLGALGTGNTIGVGAGMLPETVAEMQETGEAAGLRVACRDVSYSGRTTSSTPNSAPTDGGIVLTLWMDSPSTAAR